MKPTPPHPFLDDRFHAASRSGVEAGWGACLDARSDSIYAGQSTQTLTATKVSTT